MGGGGTGDAARKLLTVEDYVCINDCEITRTCEMGGPLVRELKAGEVVEVSEVVEMHEDLVRARCGEGWVSIRCQWIKTGLLQKKKKRLKTLVGARMSLSLSKLHLSRADEDGTHDHPMRLENVTIDGATSKKNELIVEEDFGFGKCKQHRVVCATVEDAEVWYEVITAAKLAREVGDGNELTTEHIRKASLMPKAPEPEPEPEPEPAPATTVLQKANKDKTGKKKKRVRRTSLNKAPDLPPCAALQPEEAVTKIQSVVRGRAARTLALRIRLAELTALYQ